MAQKKMVITYFAILLTVVSICIGVPYLTSKQIEYRLQSVVANPEKVDSSFRNLKHDSGIFTSKGSFDIGLHSECGLDNNKDLLTFQVEYSASHIPSLTAINSFEWKISPSNSPLFTNIFGINSKITGKGYIAFNGVVNSSIELPAVAISVDGDNLQATPSKGLLTLDQSKMNINLDLERAAVRGNGKAFELKQLKIDANINTQKPGVGSGLLTVASIGTSKISIEDIKLYSETLESGDHLDTKITESAGKFQLGNQIFKNIAIEADLKGLHAQSIHTLSRLASETCGFQDMTLDESNQFKNSLRNILVTGISFSIPKLTGNNENGGIDGDFAIRLLPSKDTNSVSLASQLSSSGHVAIKGGFLTNEQKQFINATGYISEDSGILKSDFEYAGGVVKISKKTIVVSEVLDKLNDADGEINAFFSNDSDSENIKHAIYNNRKTATEIDKWTPPSTVPAPQPASISTTQVIEPESRTYEPPPEECRTIQTCADQSLKAVRANNIDLVRQIASRIDSMPKPDMGNKAQSRKLNGKRPSVPST